MKQEEIRKKWAATEKMLKVDFDKEFHGEGEDRRADYKCLVKCNLSCAILALRTLDFHDDSYKVPWTREQFMWALKDPVGKAKWKQTEQWKHDCWAMAKKYGGAA